MDTWCWEKFPRPERPGEEADNYIITLRVHKGILYMRCLSCLLGWGNGLFQELAQTSPLLGIREAAIR